VGLTQSSDTRGRRFQATAKVVLPESVVKHRRRATKAVAYLSTLSASGNGDRVASASAKDG
jgi:hypothetical protein